MGVSLYQVPGNTPGTFHKNQLLELLKLVLACFYLAPRYFQSKSVLLELLNKQGEASQFFRCYVFILPIGSTGRRVLRYCRWDPAVLTALFGQSLGLTFQASNYPTFFFFFFLPSFLFLRPARPRVS